jgi:hypothetical protein
MSKSTDIWFAYTDENYLTTLKVKLLSGRFLTPTDTSTERGVAKVFVNEEVLKDFSSRIDIQWWMFLAAGAAALLIAGATVSYQSIRAALTNPVNAIRSDGG